MKSRKNIIAVSVAVLILVSCVSVCIGSFPLSFYDIFEVVTHKATDTMGARVFWNLRLPRVFTGLVAGAALGLAGGVYQTIFRNPLASPDLTGVASGASLGAACAIVLGAGSAASIMLSSFIMGIISLLFVLLLVRFSSIEKTGSYILSGIIVSSLADAGLMIIKYLADPEMELQAIEFWIMGTLGSITKGKIFPQFIFVVAAMILLIVFNRQALMLSLGTQHARSLGLSPSIWRTVFLGLSTLMIAGVVSLTGAISFVGLISPHIAFMMYKRRDKTYFALCAVMGSLILLFSDILARTISEGVELPLSIFTVILSVPVLLFLLCRKKGGKIEHDF